MTDTNFHKVFAVLCVVAIITSVGVAFNKAMSLPTVFFSYSTGNCVAVDNHADTDFSCENLPKRYYHNYVE